MNLNEIPTGLSKREGRLLNHLPEYHPTVIEVGSLFGYSTLQLSETAQKVIAIDPHEGYPLPESPSTWDDFMRNITIHGRSNIVPVKDYFQNVNIPEAHMAFVDLDGRFNTTIRCLHALKHIPMIIVHDFGNRNYKGVDLAVKQFNRNIRVIDTCAILT